MIEKMKVVHIVAAQTQKTELLDALRALGIVHFAEKADADQTYLERFAALSRLITVLEEQGVSEVEAETLDDVKFKQLYDGLNACLERKKALEAERAAAVSACDTLAGWGSFSPAEIKELKAQGFELHFCRVDKKLLASLEADEEVRFLRLAPVGKQQTVAILGALPASCAAGEFIPPEKSLDEYRQEIADCERGLAECGAQLKAAAKHLPSFREQLLKTQNDADYSSVRNTSESGDGLVWLTGYLPVDEAERFKAAAAKEHWAWAMDDPAADDDKVPTKIKYTKVTRLIAPVFDILGTVPGYREYDISFWFLGFFTLFFAMIIGDAGYGCLFLLTAAALTVKSKKPSDAVQLLWVLSIATIVWGAMTGTWFGLEGAMDVPLLRSLVVPTFANYPEYFNVSTTQQQNSVMKFCFILGTVQLSLACVMNIRRKTREKDLSWVADLGWLCAICALYFVVLYLVIGEQECYNCSTQKSHKGCFGHYIRAVVLEQLVLQNLQRVIAYVQEDENEFARLVMRNQTAAQAAEQMQTRRLLEKNTRRMNELDTIIQRLYEDNISGKLTDERFKKLSEAYEQEQATLRENVPVLAAQLQDADDKMMNVQHFLKAVRKYTQPEKLTAAMLRELVERVVVYAPDKSSGHRVQRIDVYYTFIGKIDFSPEYSKKGTA